MKQVIYISTVAILFSNFHCSANSDLRKGCHFYLSHEVQGDRLIITSGFSGEDCNGATVLTQVFFGNGDQATWTTTTESYSTSYTYPSFGHYTVQVFLNGQYDSEFDVVIGQDTSGGISGCDSSIGCSPSFEYELSYSQTREEYFLTCTRTDACHEKEFSWLIGSSSVSVNPVTIPFGKIEEGSDVKICLKLQFTSCDTFACKNILFNLENATIIDEPTDSTTIVTILPNPVYNNLEVKTMNLKGNAELAVYSLEGRKILDYELKHSATTETFSIDVKNIPTGIYFLKVYSEDTYTSVQKIVKE